MQDYDRRGNENCTVKEGSHGRMKYITIHLSLLLLFTCRIQAAAAAAAAAAPKVTVTRPIDH